MTLTSHSGRCVGFCCKRDGRSCAGWKGFRGLHCWPVVSWSATWEKHKLKWFDSVDERLTTAPSPDMKQILIHQSKTLLWPAWQVQHCLHPRAKSTRLCVTVFSFCAARLLASHQCYFRAKVALWWQILELFFVTSIEIICKDTKQREREDSDADRRGQGVCLFALIAAMDVLGH